ncbi:MgtC/SapB family protein [Candidatus Woesearchaeota archaeon]|nr:MgtC/SapB family protein [Candidatus Woesearchaeota archaeon]
MSEITLAFFINFLVAIAMGVLVGLEREFSLLKDKKESFGGIRTFTLVSILGALVGYLAYLYSFWILVAGIVCFAVFAIVFYLAESQITKSVGATTEIASFAVFMIGAMCMVGQLRLAVISAIIVTLFLSLKGPLHTFVHKMNKEDIYSTLKFAIIAFIILPFLPNQAYGPYSVFNPYKIWWIVVLISGISFLGYITMKIVGTKKGIGLTGFLGGFVSSTAVSMSMANTSKTVNKIVNPFVFAMVIASSTMFFRVLVVISILNKSLLPKLLIPLIAMGATGVIAALLVWTRKEKISEKDKDVNIHSPFTMKPALKFAVFFIIVLFIAKIGLEYLGSKGVYLSALLSGLADVDALVVSVAELAKAGSITANVGVVSVVIAVIVNTIVKAGIANVFGSSEFKKKVNVIFAAIIAVGAISLLFI